MNTALRPFPASSRTRLDPRSRHRVRLVAMSLSIAVAVLYALIAANVLTVISGPAEQVAAEQLAFAAPAAAVHGLGALLLWRVDRRLLWVAGAVLQVVIIAMYFAVAPQRDPMFELWGVAIRVLQFGLLAALAYLAVRPTEHRGAAAETD